MDDAVTGHAETCSHYARRMEDEEVVATIDPEAGAGVIDDGVEEELLIEEISIDGMCGVY